MYYLHVQLLKCGRNRITYSYGGFLYFRGVHLKMKRRFIVGNVSKWIQCDQREDLATHKWMIYVRGDKDGPDVADVVTKVNPFAKVRPL
jgi:hypothetical protein